MRNVLAGEELTGAIVAPDDFDLSAIEGLLGLGKELFFGGAHTAGYGRARVEEIEVVGAWQEYQPAAPKPGKVIVTLLSDTILRDKSGQVNGDLDAALSKLLEHKVEAEQKFQQMQLVGGFNRKWGLPLVQDWALSAGSVYVYSDKTIDADILRAKLSQGIGERRAEGYGRVAVNWHTLPKLQQVPARKAVGVPSSLSPESRALAELIAQRRLQQQLERRLMEFLSKAVCNNLPENTTQLSRIRHVTQQVLLGSGTEGLAMIARHLDNLKGSRKQLAGINVNDQGILEWLAARVTSRDVKVQLLGSRRLPRVAGVTAEMTETLRVHYTARMIDGVLKKMIREVQ